MILGAPDDTLREISRDICTFFNQESALVTYAECETHFMKERIHLDD